MVKIIDISVPLQSNMPIWPGSIGIHITRIKSFEDGDMVNVSKLECDVHIGTHIDAPSHFVENGATIEKLPLDILIGPVVVVNLPYVNIITASDLDNLGLPQGTKRLLFRTSNSELWRNEISEFQKDYVALSSDAARWIVDQEIHLIGVDYLSVQCYNDNPITHQILLKAGVIIVEGLNLIDVKQGTYQLICLPINLVGVEGAPARAVLLTQSKITG